VGTVYDNLAPLGRGNNFCRNNLRIIQNSDAQSGILFLF
jgi:hypothetical protein